MGDEKCHYSKRKVALLGVHGKTIALLARPFGALTTHHAVISAVAST